MGPAESVVALVVVARAALVVGSLAVVAPALHLLPRPVQCPLLRHRLLRVRCRRLLRRRRVLRLLHVRLLRLRLTVVDSPVVLVVLAILEIRAGLVTVVAIPVATPAGLATVATTDLDMAPVMVPARLLRPRHRAATTRTAAVRCPCPVTNAIWNT